MKKEDTTRIKEAFKKAFYELQNDPEANFATRARNYRDDFKRLRNNMKADHS